MFGSVGLLVEASLIAVMIAARDDDHILAFDGVDDAMLVIDPAGPISGEVAFERFRFTNPCKWRATNVVAENLIKCHPYYRGLSALWMQRKVDPRDRRCRIANRAMRMVYQLVGGRQLWRGKGVDREYLLAKLQEFHRVHKTPIDQSIRDMNEAFVWLPQSAYAAEAKPLAELARKQRRGVQRIGDLMTPLLIRLGVVNTPETEVQSNTSEARSSD